MWKYDFYAIEIVYILLCYFLFLFIKTQQAIIQNLTENEERSVVTLGASAYPDVCEIQREADF